jgi:H+/Cl- antiporter ClcA
MASVLRGGMHHVLVCIIVSEVTYMHLSFHILMLSVVCTAVSTDSTTHTQQHWLSLEAQQGSLLLPYRSEEQSVQRCQAD